MNLGWLFLAKSSPVMMLPTQPTPPERPSDFALYAGVQMITTKSLSRIACSMNAGS